MKSGAKTAHMRRMDNAGLQEDTDSYYVPMTTTSMTNNNDPTKITEKAHNDTTNTNTNGKIAYLLDVYETRQKHGYLSILFSSLQTIVLAVMMSQCGVAPIRINPMVGPYPDALSYWGAKNSFYILEEDEKWRLLSPILLHAGVIHLVGNVSVQLDIGTFFEREWGSWNWFLVYVSSSLGASILSMCIMPASLSVGSSGGIMGLFGAKLAEIYCRCCEPQETLQQRAGHQVRRHHLILCLGGVFIVMSMSFLPYVDWAAHLGGLLVGLAVGCTIFATTYMQSILCRILFTVIGILSTVILVTVPLLYMYHFVQPVEQLEDICGYYQEVFDNYECSTCTKED